MSSNNHLIHRDGDHHHPQLNDISTISSSISVQNENTNSNQNSTNILFNTNTAENKRSSPTNKLSSSSYDNYGFECNSNP